MQLKFGHNIVFVLIRQNMQLHQQLLCKNMLFLFAPWVKENKKIYIQDPKITINIKTSPLNESA
jgi:hypothetical protein